MTVFRNRRRKNRWAYVFELGGKVYQGYCVDPDDAAEARTKREAIAIQEKIRVRARARQGRPANGVRPGAFTLAQAVALHIQAQTDSSALHVLNLKNDAREILGHFGPDTAVTDITAIEISAYRVACAAQTIKVWRGGTRKDRDRADPRWWKDTGRLRSAETANHYLDCLRAALGAAHATRDPQTGQSMLPFPPGVDPFHTAGRKPTPMPDTELEARAAVARPWTAEAIELARLFGLRQREATQVTVRHVRTEQVDQAPYRFLAFRGEEVKSGRDEHMHGGWAGSALLERLVAQAEARGIEHLIAWPGLPGVKQMDRGETPEPVAWRPLKSIRRSFKSSGRKAGIVRPHRYHDVRARYGTELAKTAPGRVVQEAMRHKDFATTQLYIDAAEMDVMQAVNVATAARRSPANHEQIVKAAANEEPTKSLTKVPNKRKSRPREAG